MANIWLAHVTVYDTEISAEKTLYFSSASYTTGTTNLPPGASNHLYYDPRIKQPAVLRRDIFDNAKTFGASKAGYGAMELVNIDGGLDAIANYGLDGRRIVIIMGTVTPNSAPVWTTVFTGTMEQAEISWDRVSIRIKDRQYELDVPLNKNTYGGTNALPNGLDGVAGDLKGKQKPICLGQVLNISPPQVNTSRLIYQVHDGAVTSIDAVYDRGAPFTAGASYSSQSDMETNAPAAGQHRAWLTGGFFRLGSAPTGTITADVTQGAAAGNRTAAQLLKTIVTGYTTVAVNDIDATDLTALDTANSSVLGYYSDSDTKCSAAMDAISNSVGAWFGFDNTGKLRMRRFTAPGSTQDYTLIPADIIKIDKIASKDVGRGVTAWKIKLNYKRFYTKQDNDLAGSVTAARRSELSLEKRSIEAIDNSVKTKHLLATDLEIDTLLMTEANANTEAARLLALYSVDRDMFEVRVALDSSAIASIDLASIVQLKVNRFGMSAGKNFVVIGIKPDLRLKLIDLTLWG